MFFDFLSHVPELLNMTWGDLAKVFIGAFMVAFFAAGWVRTARKGAKDQIKAERLRAAAQHDKETAEFGQKIAELKSEHVHNILDLRTQMAEAENARKDAESERDKTTATLVALQRRLADLEAFDGKLWEQEAKDPAPFIVSTDRPTRFVAVVNLKGGVGKTTLTANVGVSLARRGRRVLLVDLDFQSSLTRLCVASSEQLLDLIRKKSTAARLLDSKDDPAVLANLIQRVSHANLVGFTCDFVAADETLAEAELRAQARWLVTKTPDARFLFRRLFHSKEITDRYDGFCSTARLG